MDFENLSAENHHFQMDSFERMRAMDRALKLLSFRLRSVCEVKQRLRRAGFNGA